MLSSTFGLEENHFLSDVLKILTHHQHTQTFTDVFHPSISSFNQHLQRLSLVAVHLWILVISQPPLYNSSLIPAFFSFLSKFHLKPLQQLTNSAATMSHYQGGYLAVPSFDGPSDTRSDTSRRSGGSQSRHQSQLSGSHVSASYQGSQAPGSRRPSNSGASSEPQGYPKPLGYDPGREKKFGEGFNKNVDLPPEAYVEVSSQPRVSKFHADADLVQRANLTLHLHDAPALAHRARRSESR